MANSVKSTKPKTSAAKHVRASRTKKTAEEKLSKDREEKVDIRNLAKDERTWKILGTVSLLTAVFLFIAFSSYLFTWRQDQSQVINRGVGYLFEYDEPNKVGNLLGRLGAWTSHNIIFNGFGLASFLFCTFFFTLGVNLLFDRKVFSMRRNLKYVTIGLIIASTTFAFVFPNVADAFPFGGSVGNMISGWLTGLLGKVGTAGLLLVVIMSYLIWQFNPTFRLPERKRTISEVGDVSDEEPLAFNPVGKSVNDMFA